MVEIEGVVYYTAADAARYLGIKRCMFYTNVKNQLEQYKVGPRKRFLYRRHDLDQFNGVQPIARAS